MGEDTDTAGLAMTRQSALRLLDPVNGKARDGATISSSFRCWTPSEDWVEGEAGLESLRRVVRAFLVVAGRDHLNPDAVIAGSRSVIVEAASSDHRPAVSITFVLSLDQDARQREARCYYDPRVLTDHG